LRNSDWLVSIGWGNGSGLVRLMSAPFDRFKAVLLGRGRRLCMLLSLVVICLAGLTTLFRVSLEASPALRSFLGVKIIHLRNHSGRSLERLVVDYFHDEGFGRHSEDLVDDGSRIVVFVGTSSLVGISRLAFSLDGRPVNRHFAGCVVDTFETYDIGPDGSVSQATTR
jgi:hypothetical protein